MERRLGQSDFHFGFAAPNSDNLSAENLLVGSRERVVASGVHQN